MSETLRDDEFIREAADTEEVAAIPFLAERDSSRLRFRAKARARFALDRKALIGSDQRVLVLFRSLRLSITVKSMTWKKYER